MWRSVVFSLLGASTMTISAATGTAGRLETMGMVNVAVMDSTIRVDLMYAKADNFTGVVLYDDLREAYLHPAAAKALVKAQATLHEIDPSLNLLVKDASRPMSVQRKMYRVVQGTPKAPYVSNPRNGGGLHNYGLAVDVTIVDGDGNELQMGTPVDYLGKEANIDCEKELVASGKITEQERENRMLLRRVMKAGGFTPLRSEWWHFNLVSRAVARARYKLIDF